MISLKWLSMILMILVCADEVDSERINGSSDDDWKRKNS